MGGLPTEGEADWVGLVTSDITETEELDRQISGGTLMDQERPGVEER